MLRSPHVVQILDHGVDAATNEPFIVMELLEGESLSTSALLHLGYREREVENVLAELRADASLAGVGTSELLRAALCRIRPTAR